MNVKDTIINCMMLYPSLFENRLDVLDHLFLTIGNGYEWVNGELVSNDKDCNTVPSYQDAVIKQLSEAQKQIENLSDYDDDAEEMTNHLIDCILKRRNNYIERLHNVKTNMEIMAVREKDSNNKFGDETCLYPLSKYSRIMNIPEDVKADWLEAAKDLYNFLMTSDSPLVSEYRKENKDYLNQIKL